MTTLTDIPLTDLCPFGNCECGYPLDEDGYCCKCKMTMEDVFYWPFVLTSEEIAAWTSVSPRMRNHLAALKARIMQLEEIMRAANDVRRADRPDVKLPPMMSEAMARMTAAILKAEEEQPECSE